ncbi:MAG: energy transducer TonB [Bacteroidota bacterium]
MQNIYKYLILLLMCFHLFGINQTGYAQIKDDSVYKQVDTMPRYPGSDDARMKYLRENIHYPEMARESGVQGTVYITFVVEKDGTVTNAEVLRGIGGGCDEEALRIVQNMPPWIPGYLDGEPVRVQFNMPFRYKLAGDDDDDADEEDKSWLRRFWEIFFG